MHVAISSGFLTWRSIVRVGIALSVLMLLISPPTAAQDAPVPLYEFETQVTPATNDIIPGVSLGVAVLHVSINCTVPLYTAEPQRIQLDVVTDPPHIEAVLDENTIFLGSAACLTLGSALETTVRAYFDFPRHFAALDTVNLQVTASHQEQQETIADWNQTAGHYGRWHMELESHAYILDLNETLNAEGIISSRSNAPVELQIELQDPPEYGTLQATDRVELPYDPDVINQDAPISLEYTRTARGTENLNFWITGNFLDTPSEALESVGMYVKIEDPQENLASELPALWPSLMILVTLTLLFLVRRRTT